MYITEGLMSWARLVVASNPHNISKVIAWWNGQPVKFYKGDSPSHPKEAFEIWGSEAAKAHAIALKKVVTFG